MTFADAMARPRVRILQECPSPTDRHSCLGIIVAVCGLIPRIHLNARRVDA